MWLLGKTSDRYESLPAAPRPQSPLNAELAAIASPPHTYSDLEAKTNAEVVALLNDIRDELHVIKFPHEFAGLEIPTQVVRDILLQMCLPTVTPRHPQVQVSL